VVGCWLVLATVASLVVQAPGGAASVELALSRSKGFEKGTEKKQWVSRSACVSTCE